MLGVLLLLTVGVGGPEGACVCAAVRGSVGARLLCVLWGGGSSCVLGGGSRGLWALDVEGVLLCFAALCCTLLASSSLLLTQPALKRSQTASSAGSSCMPVSSQLSAITRNPPGLLNSSLTWLRALSARSSASCSVSGSPVQSRTLSNAAAPLCTPRW